MMQRFIIGFCGFIVLLWAAHSILHANEESLDPKYVEFCLSQLSDEMRLEFEALRCVLTVPEFRELLSQPFDYKRRLWIDRYWNSRDPVYTTPENEILIEHKRRVATAQSEFFISGWPTWDKRGEIIIRFGAPAQRDLIEPEVDQKQALPPGELWYYPHHDLYVLFEDPYSNGHYTYYLERVEGPPSIRMRKIEKDIDAKISNMDDAWMVVPPPSIAVTSLYDKYQKKIGKLYELIRTTPSTYRYNFDNNQLPFVFGVDNFRGGKGLDRVDVNIEFEADLGGTKQYGIMREYRTTAVFWDSERKEVGRRDHSIELSTTGELESAIRLMPAQLIFSLPPGFYHMAVSVEEKSSGRISSYKTDVACPDFESKLAISDILFASRIQPTKRTSPFSRGALEVVPHPTRRYRKSFPVPLYFEVYNLQLNEQGLSSYSVEYRIVLEEQAKTGFWDHLRGREVAYDISSSFQSSSHGPDDVVQISLDSDNLREGLFEFFITITDLLSGESVSRRGSFTIEKQEPD